MLYRFIPFYELVLIIPREGKNVKGCGRKTGEVQECIL